MTPISQHQTVDGEHGRIETRQYWQVEAPDHLHDQDQWPDLRRVGLVQATREVQGQTTTEIRYYLSSLPVDAVRLGRSRAWPLEH